MEARQVVVNIGGAFLDGFDSFLQKKSFRRLPMKLPLHHYKHFVLLLLQLSTNFLEWLYADKDLLIATWSVDSVPRFCPHHHSVALDKGFGFVVLGCSSPLTVLLLVYEEDSLVTAYFRYAVQLTISRIPQTRGNRETRTELLLQVYEDYLCSGEFKLYFKETFRDTVKTVQESAPGNTATLGLSAAASSLGHATAGFAFTLAVDVAVTIRAVSKARRLRKAGEITEREFKTAVKRKVRQTSCQLVAGSTGSMIGQIVIPVPVVGAMIGGFLGGLIGAGVSKGMDKIEEVREKKKPRGKRLGLVRSGESLLKKIMDDGSKSMRSKSAQKQKQFTQ